MTTLRHRTRHAHQSIVDYVKATLLATGWTSGTPPFGAPEMTVLDYEPQESGEIPPLQTVCISFGDEDDPKTFDLGGGLYETRYPIFIDVYPIDESIGVAIADDIKDALVEGYVHLYDYTGNSPVDTGMVMEITKIKVRKIPASGKLDKRSWRVVNATAILQYTP